MSANANPSPRPVRELLLIGASFLVVVAASLAMARFADTTGLECADYANPSWEGRPFQTRVEREFVTPLFATRPARTVPAFSTECRGSLAVVQSGTYHVMLVTRASAELWVDDTAVLQSRGPGLQRAHGIVDLATGLHQLRFRYALSGGGDELELVLAHGRGPLRPLDPTYVSRQPLPAAVYRLRQPAQVAAVALPLLWIGLLVYRHRLALRRLVGRMSPALIGGHQRLTGRPVRSLATLVIVAAAVRAALTFGTYPLLWPDSLLYYDTALSYVQGDFLPHSVVYTPLFSAFLAAFLAVDMTPAAGESLIAVQRVLAIGTTVLVYHLARVAFDRTIAFYAALLWTVSAVQLYYETVVATEALFVTVLILTLSVASRMLRADSPRTAAMAGLMCAVATLTRPVAKGLVFIVLAIVWWRGRQRQRLVAASVVLVGTFYLGIAPWMYVNRQTYGFWGVNRGEGLWLFLRVFDIDELDPAPDTRFPEVREIVDAVRPSFSYLHNVVRDELNHGRGYSARQTDEVMFGFALETAGAHPVRFAVGTARQWALLMINPYRSVEICDSAGGPYLCAERGRDLSFPAFPNKPPPGREPLKVAIAAYFRVVYWVLPVLAPFAVIGMVRLWREQEPQTAIRVLLAVTAMYVTVAAAVFNTVQDRYRLPADAILVMFALHELRRQLARLFDDDPERPSE